ncbi:hypothetical protein MMC22_003195 [Lobaria immixta]|nr:hypothetical protein [Lobaria immixta]
MPKHQSLPRGVASGQLRRKAGWSTENGDASPGDRRNSNNFRVPRSPESWKVDSNDFSPPQRKLRLDTNTSESGESIKQASITTVISPSKPQIISITRRSSSFQNMSSFQTESRFVSNPFPVTPPETPVRDQKLRNGIGNILEPERTHAIRGNPSDKIKLCVTPPNMPFSSHCIPECQGSDVSYGSSRSSIRTSLRHQPWDWILDELEFTVTNFPRVRLQLNSPVIQHLRLPDADFFVKKWRERNASSPSKLPHSRYSIFKSLSSHPATPQGAQIPRGFLQNSNLAAFDSLHPDPLTDPTVCALQTIFPNAELPALECLQATYLALNYLLLTQPPSFTPPCFLPSSPGGKYPLSLSTVPPKAREMLGIQPPASNSLPKTWFNPQTLQSGDNGLRKRIDDLVERLRDMVGDLLGELGKKRPGMCDNAILTAVGEVIKMGEERRK